MARGDRRDLFLSIGGNVTGLQAASKAGRTALLELARGADDVQAEVSKALEQMGANAPAAAKQIEQSYNKTFAAIRRNAEAALNAPSSGKALQIIDAAAAEQAAQKAEQLAVQLRLEATAAATVAQRAGEASSAHRVLAVAMEANAQQAENEAVALRETANVLGAVRTELGSMGAAQRNIVAVSGQQRNSTIMLGQQLQDFSVQVVSGQSVATAFAQQIGQTAFAIQGMGGKLEGVAAFLTSGWGIAATVGLTVLAPLVAKIFEGSDALQKEIDKLQENAEKARIADEAKAAFARTEDGLIDGVHKLTAELDKQNDALKTNAERWNLDAKNKIEALRDRRTNTAQELGAAEQNLRNTPLTGDGAEPGTISATYRAAQQRVADLKAKLANEDANIAEAVSDYQRSRAALADEAAQRAVDPIAQIKRTYEGPDGLIEQAKKRAIVEGTVTAELTRQLTVLRQREKTEIEAEQKRQSEARGSSNLGRQSGRQITLSEAESIVTGIGGRVTSAERSTAKQRELYARYLAGQGPLAAKPGTSYHERGQALDIAKGNGITLAAIVKAFNDAGVRLVEKLDEGDHYHVAWKSTAAEPTSTIDLAGTAGTNVNGVLDALSKGLIGAPQRFTEAQQRSFDAIIGKGDPFADVIAQSTTAFKAQQEETLATWREGERNLERMREDNLRTLSNVYEDLFSGRVRSVWEDFERLGIEALARLAAKWTPGQLQGLSGKGGFLGDIAGLVLGGGTLLGFAGGGRVSGPGGPREDRVPAMLSAGEYVINAAAYARHPELVEAINTGRLPHLAGGGLVAPGKIYMRALPSASSLAARGGQGAPITFDLRGAVMTEDLLKQMNAMSAQYAQVSIVGGSRMAQSEIADHQAQAIPT